MQVTKKQKITISILSIAILFGLYILLDRKSKTEEISDTDQIVATTTDGNQIVFQGTGGYKIEQVPISENGGVPQPIPDLNRPLMFYKGESMATAEAKNVAIAKVKELQELLKKDASNFNAWLDLGMYQKMGGDYDGTIISWQYAGRLAPTSFIPPGNLANLYAYFIKDNIKAEAYYKEAITKGPAQTHLYMQLAEFYRDFLFNSAKATTVIETGLKAIPNDPNLLQLKASLN